VNGPNAAPQYQDLLEQDVGARYYGHECVTLWHECLLDCAALEEPLDGLRPEDE
jgi:hypothetical protein